MNLRFLTHCGPAAALSLLVCAGCNSTAGTPPKPPATAISVNDEVKSIQSSTTLSQQQKDTIIARLQGGTKPVAYTTNPVAPKAASK